MTDSPIASTASTLPLPLAELPASIRRFVDPQVPAAVRSMAAKGLVPLKGAELIGMLLQLAADTDAAIAELATQSLQRLPDEAITESLRAGLHPLLLQALAKLCFARPALQATLVGCEALADETMVWLAAHADEALGEAIATNQTRLLRSPTIIEALYHNSRVRMSTVERALEWAARHSLPLHGLPSYAEHQQAVAAAPPVAALADEARDARFRAALAADDEDPEAIERDAVDGSEAVKNRFQPLQFQIRDMSIAERVRLATIGSAAARALLVRDSNKTVAHAAISSPRVNESEAAMIACSREISEEILRYIGNKREWLGNYELKRALIMNAKTPIGLAMKFLGHLREPDLRALGRNRNVPAAIKNAAAQRLQQRKG